MGGKFFDSHNKNASNFSAYGQWLETKTEILVSHLPGKVVAAIKQANSKCIIVGSDKMERAKSGILYEADIQSGKNKKDVIYKKGGTFLK